MPDLTVCLLTVSSLTDKLRNYVTELGLENHETENKTHDVISNHDNLQGLYNIHV